MSELQEWFYKRSEELRKQYCPNAQPMTTVPLLVEEAWMHQEKEITRLRKALVKISDRCCEPCCLYADEVLDPK